MHLTSPGDPPFPIPTSLPDFHVPFTNIDKTGGATGKLGRAMVGYILDPIQVFVLANWPLLVPIAVALFALVLVMRWLGVQIGWGAGMIGAHDDFEVQAAYAQGHRVNGAFDGMRRPSK